MPNDDVRDLLDALWRDYVDLTPQAARIHALFAARGETIFNDHVALRSYGRPGVDVAALARPFLALGWVAQGATLIGGCCEVGPAHIRHLHHRLIGEGHQIA